MKLNKVQRQMLNARLQSEEDVIDEITKAFEAGKKEIQKAIAELAARKNMENLQSVIYQMQYQKALLAQVTDILDELHDTQYTTIADYLETCYVDNYLYVMQDIQNQGIPVITPIPQEQIVKAVQLDSKLSQPLYQALGVDIDKLKRTIPAQISAGIVAGKTWVETAADLTKGFHTPFDTAYKRTLLITRTEGHRVQCSAAYDAQQAAKDAGCDVVKQWCAALDERTRPTHRMLDGQIREINEPFEIAGSKAQYPGAFGVPAEDCNCRCASLQRAVWALDEDELKRLKERARYYNLDKSQSFEEFKKNYLEAAKQLEAQQKPAFQPAKSIKEAENYARNLGVGNVNFKGLDLQVVNEMNCSLTDLLQFCPDAIQKLASYGSAQQIQKVMRTEIADYLEQLGYSQKRAKSAANKWVGKMDSNVLAHARPVQTGIKDPTLRDIYNRGAGVQVNDKFGKDYAGFKASVEYGEKTKFHPVGCGTIRSVFDHEFGHILDYFFDLRTDQRIADEFNRASRQEIIDGLSGYACTNLAEFIAEAYSEYVNNPKPRPWAKLVGQILNEKVKGKKTK